MRFLRDTGADITDYDRIFTGDLGLVGSDILGELLLKEGVDLSGRHTDCGLLIFDRDAFTRAARAAAAAPRFCAQKFCPICKAEGCVISSSSPPARC